MNTKKFFRAAAVAALTIAVAGQARAQEPVTAEETKLRLMHGKEWMPRYAVIQPTDSIIIKAGDPTWTPPQTGTFHAVEIEAGANVKFSRTRDTAISVRHWIIHPGANVDMGTEADPIPCQFRVQVTIRDTPIDPNIDPFRWGVGWLNFGHQSRVGCRVEKAWTELTADVEAGGQQIQLDVPEGWRVGDELLFGDMRQMTQEANPTNNKEPRKESKVTISAFTSTGILLSKPLDFEHRAIKDDYGIVLRPRVGNLSRNIVIRSENPNGVRGHLLNHGRATWDIRYNEEIGLGRTENRARANATTNSNTGEVTPVDESKFTQLGRYGCDHDHHVMWKPGGVYKWIGNVCDGLNKSTWGKTLHNTHHTLVEESIVLNFLGSGYVTEDGDETFNTFRRSVAAFIRGGNNASPVTNITRNKCPGCESSAWWLRGLKNTFDQIEAWNSHIGINLIPIDPVIGMLVPAAPNTAPSVKLDPRFAVPLSMDKPVGFGNFLNNFEWWATAEFFVKDLIAAHAGANNAFAGQSQSVNAMMENPILVCDPATVKTTKAFGANQAYVEHGEIKGGRSTGCRYGVHDGGAGVLFEMSNHLMQNYTNYFNSQTPSTPTPIVFDGVKHVQLRTNPKRFWVWGDGKVWEAGQPLPNADVRRSNPQGPRGVVLNHNGVPGDNYTLFGKGQVRSAAAIPAHASAPFLCPFAGLTNGQCFDQTGIAWGASVVDDAAVVPFDGLENGVAKAGLDMPLGPPRWVLTFPNSRAAAVFPQLREVNGKMMVRLTGQVTGDHTGTSKTIGYVSIDGGPQTKVTRGPGQLFDEFSIHSEAVAPGSHTVTTWRADSNGNIMLSTRFETDGYFIGQQSTPPKPTVETNCTDNVDNDGDGKIDAADEDCVVDPDPDPPPTGEVLLSTGGTPSSSGGNAAQVFDGNASTAVGVSLPAWFQYQLAAPSVLTRYTVRPRGIYGHTNPTAWRLEGSQDGVTFTGVPLDSQSGQTFSAGETKSYDVANTTAFKFYRLTITAVVSGTQAQLSDVQFYGVTP